MEEHRETSRGGRRGRDTSRGFAGAPRTEFVGYERTDVLTAITAYADLGDGLFQVKLARVAVLSRGRRPGHRRRLDREGRRLARRARRGAAARRTTRSSSFEGDGFAAGDRVRAVVPWAVRYPTMANHTATHLLHKVLQEVLGDHVRQAGSAVRPDKLRFDFTHPPPLTPEERAEVEERVNEHVFANQPVRIFETPLARRASSAR